MATRRDSRGLGFFARLKTGWALTKDSLGVIRDHPKLMAFPLAAALSSIVFFVVLFFPLVIAGIVGSGLEYVVLFALYFLTTFTSTYFTAALVHAANEAFHGREPSMGDSMTAVSNRLGPIVVWSAVSATVSIIFRVLENSDNPIAGILRSLFAIGWSIMTFFIVPVIVFQGGSITEVFKTSGRTFRDTWGETLGAGFGITGIVIASGLVMLAVSIGLAIAVMSLFPAAGLVLGVVLVLLSITFTYLLSQTIWAVVKTALYVYAAEGHKPEQFDNFDFQTLGGRAEHDANVGAANTGRLDD